MKILIMSDFGSNFIVSSTSVIVVALAVTKKYRLSTAESSLQLFKILRDNLAFDWQIIEWNQIKVS